MRAGFGFAGSELVSYRCSSEEFECWGRRCHCGGDPSVGFVPRLERGLCVGCLHCMGLAEGWRSPGLAVQSRRRRRREMVMPYRVGVSRRSWWRWSIPPGLRFGRRCWEAPTECPRHSCFVPVNSVATVPVGVPLLPGAFVRGRLSRVPRQPGFSHPPT